MRSIFFSKIKAIVQFLRLFHGITVRIFAIEITCHCGPINDKKHMTIIIFVEVENKANLHWASVTDDGLNPLLTETRDQQWDV